MAAPMKRELVLYSESSGEESEEEKIEKAITNTSKKFKLSSDPKSTDSCENGLQGGTKSSAKLPSIPSDILSMFGNKSDTPVEDPSKHQGRVRSFGHERGNWATYIFVPFDPNEHVHRMIRDLQTCLRQDNIKMEKVDDFHVSLSRTVVLRHHWIEAFVDSVKNRVMDRQRFYIQFDSLGFYCNDEKTRSFLGLKVTTGQHVLCDLVKDMDKTLQEFKLQTYYKVPCFHMSILWALGDITDKLESTVAKLQGIVNQHLCDHSDSLTLLVGLLQCKTGNKTFNFHLASR